MIAHGANCCNYMGGGIAGIIADKYPELAAVDAATESGDITKLGGMTMETLDIESELPILGMNWYTQYAPGSNFEYMALQCCLNQIKHVVTTYIGLHAPKDRIVHLGIPMIGCGIGGGSEKIVTAMLRKKFADNAHIHLTLVKLPEDPKTLPDPGYVQPDLFEEK